MNRSEFISSLGIGSSGLILPKALLSSKLIKIYDNYVVGLPYYHHKELKEVLKEGDELILERDLENVYDSFAIKVFYQDKQLGYLKAYENIVLANLIDQGTELKAFISNINVNRNLAETLAIEIFAELILPQASIIKTTLTEKRANDANDLYRNIDGVDGQFE